MAFLFVVLLLNLKYFTTFAVEMRAMGNILHNKEYWQWDALWANGRFAIGRLQSKLWDGFAYGVLLSLSLSL